MKKKYEALAISFLVVNMIYSHGVVHLQPSIGDEIIGMLYNLFHLFEYNITFLFYNIRDRLSCEGKGEWAYMSPV